RVAAGRTVAGRGDPAAAAPIHAQLQVGRVGAGLRIDLAEGGVGRADVVIEVDIRCPSDDTGQRAAIGVALVDAREHARGGFGFVGLGWDVASRAAAASAGAAGSARTATAAHAADAAGAADPAQAAGSPPPATPPPPPPPP